MSQYELSIDGLDEPLWVRHFHIHEALSTNFVCTVVARSLAPDIDIDTPIWAPATFTLQDRDHRTAPEYALRAKATANVLETEKQLEQFEVMPGRFLVQSNQSGGTPVADDRGMVRSDERHAENLA
jgi:hypothetical protein